MIISLRYVRTNLLSFEQAYIENIPYIARTNSAARLYTFFQVEAIIRANVIGAAHPDAKVLIFDHAIRSGGQKLAEIEQVNPYAGLVHSDASVRSGHSRAKDQIMGTNETEVKYGALPACWGDVRPTRVRSQFNGVKQSDSH